MSTSLKGPDVATWWQNRATRRRETNQAVHPLREARKRLLEAAGDAKPVAVTVDPNTSADSLVKMADNLIASLNTERARVPKFDQALRQEEMNVDSVKESVRKAAHQRARSEAEQQARKEFEARQAGRKAQRNMKRMIALAIAAAIAFVLYRF